MPIESDYIAPEELFDRTPKAKEDFSTPTMYWQEHLSADEYEIYKQMSTTLLNLFKSQIAETVLTQSEDVKFYAEYNETVLEGFYSKDSSLDFSNNLTIAVKGIHKDFAANFYDCAKLTGKVGPGTASALHVNGLSYGWSSSKLEDQEKDRELANQYGQSADRISNAKLRVFNHALYIAQAVNSGLAKIEYKNV